MFFVQWSANQERGCITYIRAHLQFFEPTPSSFAPLADEMVVLIEQRAEWPSLLEERTLQVSDYERR